MNNEKIALKIQKVEEIKSILLQDDITFGMAKSIIQRVEVDLLRDGDTYLGKSKLRNVSPDVETNRH